MFGASWRERERESERSDGQVLAVRRVSGAGLTVVVDGLRDDGLEGVQLSAGQRDGHLEAQAHRVQIELLLPDLGPRGLQTHTHARRHTHTHTHTHARTHKHTRTHTQTHTHTHTPDTHTHTHTHTHTEADTHRHTHAHTEINFHATMTKHDYTEEDMCPWSTGIICSNSQQYIL